MGTEPELREHLVQLHDELEGTDSVDLESRELLSSLLDDIHSLLGDEGDATSRQSLVDRLGDATRRFETTHPTLATTGGRGMDTLANLGI